MLDRVDRACQNRHTGDKVVAGTRSIKKQLGEAQAARADAVGEVPR